MKCFVASEINSLRLISGNIHLQKIRNQANTEIYAGGGGGGGGRGRLKDNGPMSHQGCAHVVN